MDEASVARETDVSGELEASVDAIILILWSSSNTKS